MDENKLREFFRKEEIKMFYFRCIIVGCVYVGKIIFLKRLEMIKFEKFKNIKMMEMVDVYVNIFEVLEDGKIIECKFFDIKKKIFKICFFWNIYKIYKDIYLLIFLLIIFILILFELYLLGENLNK